MTNRLTAVLLEGEEFTRDALAASLTGTARDPVPAWLEAVLVHAFAGLVSARLPQGYELDALRGALTGPPDGEWQPEKDEVAALLNDAFGDFCAMMPGSGDDPAPAETTGADSAPRAGEDTGTPDADLPPGWKFTRVGDLVCPCGEQIEPDAVCGGGHVSPLREEGLI